MLFIFPFDIGIPVLFTLDWFQTIKIDITDISAFPVAEIDGAYKKMSGHLFLYGISFCTQK